MTSPPAPAAVCATPEREYLTAAGFDESVLKVGVATTLAALWKLKDRRLSNALPALDPGAAEDPSPEDMPTYIELLRAEREVHLFQAYALRLLDAYEARDVDPEPVRELMDSLDTYEERIWRSFLGQPQDEGAEPLELNADVLTLAAFQWRRLFDEVLTINPNASGTKQDPAVALLDPLKHDPARSVSQAMRACRWILDARGQTRDPELSRRWIDLFGADLDARIAQVRAAWGTLPPLGLALPDPPEGFFKITGDSFGVEGETDAMPTPDSTSTTEQGPQPLSDTDLFAKIILGESTLGDSFDEDDYHLLQVLTKVPALRSPAGDTEGTHVFFASLSEEMTRRIVDLLGGMHEALWEGLSMEGRDALAQSLVVNFQNAIVNHRSYEHQLRVTHQSQALRQQVHGQGQQTIGTPSTLSNQPTSKDASMPPAAPPATQPDTFTNRMTSNLSAEAIEAAERTAAKQFIKLSKAAMAATLQRHLAPGDESMKAKIGAFMETEMGGALFAAIIGMGMTAAPNIPGMPPALLPVAEKIGKQLRVGALETTGDQLAEVIMGPLRQVMAFYIQDMANAPAPALPAASESTPISAVYREKVPEASWDAPQGLRIFRSRGLGRPSTSLRPPRHAD